MREEKAFLQNMQFNVKFSSATRPIFCKKSPAALEFGPPFLPASPSRTAPTRILPLPLPLRPEHARVATALREPRLASAIFSRGTRARGRSSSKRGSRQQAAGRRTEMSSSHCSLTVRALIAETWGRKMNLFHFTF